MGLFDRFPWSDEHQLNLDWILTIIKKLQGGTTDQVLSKKSNRPLDFGWKTIQGGGGGTTDYNELGNKPSINGVTLMGNKTTEDLNITAGPELADTWPMMDGPVQVGSSTKAARADHRHPSDTSKLDISQAASVIQNYLNSQYDPAQEPYDPPYDQGTIGKAIEDALAGGVSPEAIQDAVDNYLTDHPTVTGTFTNSAKHALLHLLEYVAYIGPNGQDYLDALEGELFATEVTSISAVFTQGGTVVYDTFLLSALDSMLTVTAEYTDETTEVLQPGIYTLSGELTPGTSTITVTYQGKTDTFDVTVSTRIPTTYKQVEFIQSSGSQAITTSIVPRNTRTLVTFEFTEFHPPADNVVAGAYDPSNQRYYVAFLDNSSIFRFRNRSNQNKWTGPTSPIGKHTVDFNNASHKALYDGTVRATDSTFSRTGGNTPLGLFCRNTTTTQGGIVDFSWARIFSCEVYDNTDNSLIGNFIPCYRKADGVIGMYDTVTDTFLTDAMQSATPFIKGPDAWEL